MIKLEQVSIGCMVRINPQEDRSRKQLIEGVVQEILTKSSSHPHGILVRLTSGRTGRVKELMGDVLSSSVEAQIRETKSSDCERSILDIFNDQETSVLEFKESLTWSQDLTKEELQASNSPEIKRYGRDASKIIAAKAVASFLNSDGGRLIIGIRENKTAQQNELVGIGCEYQKLKDKCEDGYRRFILDSIFQKYLPAWLLHNFSSFVKLSFEVVEGKPFCSLTIKKASKPVWLKSQSDELFFIRVDAQTKQLNGSDLSTYLAERFS